MDTNVAVTISLALFFILVWYLGGFKAIGTMLDGRANRIRTQLDEARTAREEAQKILASFERKQQEAVREADAIVERAKADAHRAADTAKADLQDSIARKIRAAEERIAQAEARARRDVQNAAGAAAIAAAQAVIGQRLSGDAASAMLDDSIDKVASQLH